VQPWQIASIRAVAGGAVLAGAAFFGQLQTGGSLKVAGISAGVAFFGYLVTRGVVEGVIDQQASKP
jgi:hypothetical protein